MVESRSKKISVLIFLFAIFILLVVVTGGWIYRMYTEQTAYSESKTLATVECSRYYYSINPESVLYENGTLYFEISNTLGADIDKMVVESIGGQKEVDVGGLSQGVTLPVSVPMEVVEWAVVYPPGCRGVNFKNISFEPKTG
ncbi:MAG: hypothetical protein KKD17_05830 [Nanoarchaeota archaeon]|nr:hypothetical protein [Nanoarchaeota archaeon]